jgi:hypothetical protein
MYIQNKINSEKKIRQAEEHHLENIHPPTHACVPMHTHGVCINLFVQAVYLQKTYYFLFLAQTTVNFSLNAS